DRDPHGLHARPSVPARAGRDRRPPEQPARRSHRAGGHRRRLHDRARRFRREPPEVTMSARRKLMLGIVGFYLLGIVLLVVIFGFGSKNNSFQIQNEFKLTNWVSLGVFSINRAVVYLFLAAI